MSAPRIDRGDLYWIDPEALPGGLPGPAHPHLVVQDDALNHSRVHSTVVCALTSNLRRANEPGNVLLGPGEGGLERQSVIVVSQVAAVDKTRLGAHIGRLDARRVDQALAGLRFLQRAFFDR